MKRVDVVAIFFVIMVILYFVMGFVVIKQMADLTEVMREVSEIKVYELPYEAMAKEIDIPEEESITVAETASQSLVEPPVTYYDVPLDDELQNHIFAICDEAEIDPRIVIAMIEKESMYKADVMGDNGRSFGLMQIQKRWHEDRMKRLGCNDLLDPYQNITVGVDLLSELNGKGNSIEWTLMAYNGGVAYANKKVKTGIVSDYAKDVISISENLWTRQ